PSSRSGSLARHFSTAVDPSARVTRCAPSFRPPASRRPSRQPSPVCALTALSIWPASTLPILANESERLTPDRQEARTARCCSDNLLRGACEGAAGSAGRTESTSLKCSQPKHDLLAAWQCGPRAGEGDVMATLPAHPHLDHRRHQAKDLLRAARQGDQRSVEMIRQFSGRLTLAAAQLAVARDYGFPSWRALKADVAARGADLAGRAAAFVRASVADWTGRAARLLAAT